MLSLIGNVPSFSLGSRAGKGPLISKATTYSVCGPEVAGLGTGTRGLCCQSSTAGTSLDTAATLSWDLVSLQHPANSVGPVGDLILPTFLGGLVSSEVPTANK